MNVLHIASSPRGDRSLSLHLARAFLNSLAEDQRIAVDDLDVWTSDLLPFDGPALNAKYADLKGVEMTDDQKKVWQQIHDLGARFHAADVIL